MVVAPHYVGDFEIGVVQNSGKVVGRHAVGAENDQIVQFAILKYRMPLDQIFNHGLTVARRAETDSVVASASAVGQRQLGRIGLVAAGAVVAGFAMLPLGLAPFRFELLRRAVAWIRFALAQQARGGFAIAIETAGLEVTAVGRSSQS